MPQHHEPLKIVRGSGNVFRDLGHPNAVVQQAKAVLAANIIKTMDTKTITARQANAQTGIATKDFSRIRHAKLDRFTIDQLIIILERLDNRIEVQMSVSQQTVATTPVFVP